MIEDKFITNKDIKKLINIANYKNKTSRFWYYVFTIFGASLSMLVAINMHTNSIITSLLRFSFEFFAITIFLSALYYYMNKISIVGGLYQTGYIIDKIANDDWSYIFEIINKINKAVLVHPLFKAIIGLYICKYGNRNEGLAIINKAADDLPCLREIVIDGTVVDAYNFKNLKQKIVTDVMPNIVLFFKGINILFAVEIFLVYAIGLALLVSWIISKT